MAEKLVDDSHGKAVMSTEIVGWMNAFFLKIAKRPTKARLLLELPDMQLDVFVALGNLAGAVETLPATAITGRAVDKGDGAAAAMASRSCGPMSKSRHWSGRDQRVARRYGSI